MWGGAFQILGIGNWSPSKDPVYLAASYRLYGKNVRSVERRKIAWVRWELVYKPKKEGPLGVKNFEWFNSPTSQMKIEGP